MRIGNRSIVFYTFLFFFSFAFLNAQEKINLQDLQPTFEEEQELTETNKNDESYKIKSKGKKTKTSNQTVAKLRALDKITARTSDIDVIIGKKRNFGYLEILFWLHLQI